MKFNQKNINSLERLVISHRMMSKVTANHFSGHRFYVNFDGKWVGHRISNCFSFHQLKLWWVLLIEFLHSANVAFVDLKMGLTITSMTLILNRFAINISSPPSLFVARAPITSLFHSQSLWLLFIICGKYRFASFFWPFRDFSTIFWLSFSCFFATFDYITSLGFHKSFMFSKIGTKMEQKGKIDWKYYSPVIKTTKSMVTRVITRLVSLIMYDLGLKAWWELGSLVSPRLLSLQTGWLLLLIDMYSQKSIDCKWFDADAVCWALRFDCWKWLVRRNGVNSFVSQSRFIWVTHHSAI